MGQTQGILVHFSVQVDCWLFGERHRAEIRSPRALIRQSRFQQTPPVLHHAQVGGSRPPASSVASQKYCSQLNIFRRPRQTVCNL